MCDGNVAKVLLWICIGCALTGCGMIEKDNLPPPTALRDIHPAFHLTKLWSVQVAAHARGYHRLYNRPIVTATTVFTTDLTGTITAVNRVTGRIQWQTKTHYAFAAGPAVTQQLVVAVSRAGQVFALDSLTGAIRWRVPIGGVVLAQPLLYANQVIVKTVAGEVVVLTAAHGQQQWVFHDSEPVLILQRASVPVVWNHDLFVGFANGRFMKLDLATGKLIWVQVLAVPQGVFALQRMVDLDVDPILFQHTIYVAGYQGYLDAISLSGHILWSRRLSAYTGMTVDQDTVYISAADSCVRAFDRMHGTQQWQQSQLAARSITGPVDFGNTIVVGDAEGVLHWLDKRSGRIVARQQVGAGIFATPVVRANVLYVLDDNGYLSAYVIA